MASPLQFAYRTQKAIGVFDAAPVYEPLPGFTPPREGSTLRCCAYSPCGRYFAYATGEGVTVIDASVGYEVGNGPLPLPVVYELGFSPLGNYLCTWEKPSKDENGDAAKNLKIWRVVNGKDGADSAGGGGGENGTGNGAEPRQPIGQFVQKSAQNWMPQYTADERYCARLVTNEIQFYESHDLKTVRNKLHVEGVADFAVGPGKEHTVAVFVPEKKVGDCRLGTLDIRSTLTRSKQGQPSAVRVYKVPHFASPVSQKSFFKGDKVQLKWNAQGSHLIVLAQTEVDRSGKSYYGETTLYLMSANGSVDERVTLDKEGPIHDVCWSPNSKEFGVVYGFTPPKATIFNNRGIATHSFAPAPRNTIRFSPSARFVLVAGFGNMTGQIDVYDLEKDYKKVCTIESGNPSVCEWSPDSTYIMTATTSPRLRVDNGVKLWHVGGGIMYNADMVELYNVMWRPIPKERIPGIDPLSSVPAPHESALKYLGTIKTPSKPAGAYRPPGARGTSTPLHFKREDEGGAAHTVSNGTSMVGPNGFGRPRHQIPGAEFVERPAVPGATPADAPGGEEGLSKAALKNKKKRNNKKAKEAENQAAGGGGASLMPPPNERGPGSGNEGRSPERRGAFQGHHHHRSRSRNNFQEGYRSDGGHGSRSRSNTGRGNNGYGHGQGGHGGSPHGGSPHGGYGSHRRNEGSQDVRNHQPQQQQQHVPAHAHAPAAPSHLQTEQVLSPDSEVASPFSANPDAKKIRGLQKKIRAIEDLEMRLAGGEKLEDTQIKKIATKAAVLAQLEALEKSLG